MDVLYILGSGSQNYNNELRYSLRTLEAFASHVDRVIVAGENPGFLSKHITYIPIKEAQGNKEYRIAAKIMAAITKGNLTNDFLFLNDDFFFTQRFNAQTYPFYYKGCLSKHKASGPYADSLNATYQYLKSHNLPTLHFDIHTPIIYNPQQFMALNHVWQYSKTLTSGLVVKSCYANHYHINGINTIDCKLLRLETYRDFERIFNKRKVFSVYDQGWINGVEDYLEYKYPNPSKYESKVNHAVTMLQPV